MYMHMRTHICEWYRDQQQGEATANLVVEPGLDDVPPVWELCAGWRQVDHAHGECDDKGVALPDVDWQDLRAQPEVHLEQRVADGEPHWVVGDRHARPITAAAWQGREVLMQCGDVWCSPERWRVEIEVGHGWP